jgi:putative transposase
MGLSRSSRYTDHKTPERDAVIHEIQCITASFRGYGYRRVTTELRGRGMVVNSKKVRRIMREKGLNPKRKQRSVITTNSNHDSPIYLNVAKGFDVFGLNQLWVGGITYISLDTRF